MQHGIVTLQPIAAEACFRSSGYADALGDYSPDINFLFFPPDNRSFEIIGAQARCADDNASRYPSRYQLERGEHPRVLNAPRTRRDNDGIGQRDNCLGDPLVTRWRVHDSQALDTTHGTRRSAFGRGFNHGYASKWPHLKPLRR